MKTLNPNFGSEVWSAKALGFKFMDSTSWGLQGLMSTVIVGL